MLSSLNVLNKTKLGQFSFDKTFKNVSFPVTQQPSLHQIYQSSIIRRLQFSNAKAPLSYNTSGVVTQDNEDALYADDVTASLIVGATSKQSIVCAIRQYAELRLYPHPCSGAASVSANAMHSLHFSTFSPALSHHCTKPSPLQAD